MREQRAARLGFGVTAGYGEAILAPLAAELARLGYDAAWANDQARAGADGLADLALIHRAAPGLLLGVGVVPLDRRPPATIAADVRRLGLPLERLLLGVGSGSETARPLALVRDGVAHLRDALPGARVYVAALGPRMTELAAEVADGVLFNWAVPDRLAQARGRLDAAARTAARDPSDCDAWSYVRTAIGDDARARLGREAARYAEGAAYGRQFREMGVPLDAVGVAGEDLPRQLVPYRDVLDGVVVRALPAEPTIDALRAIGLAAIGGSGAPDGGVNEQDR